ncbi:alkaline phosphatase D family protein [Nonomuraea candida]|uniref:alkaline phosphatase D family protein n=1 Tax=Nonomuraea candida TaxID=359159 RepID=UPI000A05C07C|nr:alkaline phosphatase D family protein [Nonomuraea candida]
MLGTGWWNTGAHAAVRLSESPFTLGVASGDPGPDSVVLWTRLAVDPLAPDGFGGLPPNVAAAGVIYEVARDDQFRDVVRKGVVVASRSLGYSVHPEVYGLEPGRHYWYRFRSGDHISPVGRTRTAPAPGTMPASLSLGVASCQSYHGGHYTAHQHLAEENFDVVLFLGDYIYEENYGFTTDHSGAPLPDHMLHERMSLTDYRLQYALYKLDPHLQAAHASAPWITIFDDHEVDDNWHKDTSPGTPDPVRFGRRKAAAFQAMYENLPLRHTQIPAGPSIRMHRRIGYGDLAEFTMLDSRQYMSDRASRLDPNATMLGGEQANWLIDGFSTSRARWKIIGNQLPMAEVDRDPDPAVKSFFGAWDAYVVERERILTEAYNRDVDNLIVVTGDRHSNYLMDLKTDYDDPGSPVVGTEIVGTSISSGRDGADMLPAGQDYLRANPHMKFCNFQRGYCRLTLTPDTLTNDFRVVPYISRPGAPISTRASFVVENGVPGSSPA